MSDAAYSALVAEPEARFLGANRAWTRPVAAVPAAIRREVPASRLRRGFVWSVSLGLAFWGTVAVSVALMLR